MPSFYKDWDRNLTTYMPSFYKDQDRNLTIYMPSFYKEWDITPFKIRYRFVKYFVKLLVKYTGGDSSVDIANM